MHGVAPYPLYWPLEHARAPSRRNAQFQLDFASARADLTRQLRLLSASEVLISSNVPLRRDGLPAVPDREPEDPGVAVYFARLVGGKRKPYVLACDQFTKVRWNLRAVGATLESLRAIERHGATGMMEQAFSGFAQLPPKPADRPWREVLGVPAGPCTAAALAERYRELALEHHPDRGGDGVRMAEVNEAYARAVREVGP